MTPPSSARKLLLVLSDSTTAGDGRPAIRRYRMARLRLDTPVADVGQRFEYLKRTFD